MSSNQLNDISKVYMEAVYGGAKKEKEDTRLVVTNADKKANTKAYQNYKAGSKAYKAADHLKDNYEFARHKASVISRGGRLEDAVESWNQKVAHQEAMKEVSEKKEVNVKDTYKTVAAIVDYDRSKKGSKDATWDSVHGEKKKAEQERDYAKWERGKMKKDDPNWKSKKYHTGMHGEEKRWQDDDGDGKWYEKSDVDGKISKREKKAKKHDCASKVKHEEFGIGNPVKGMHDLDESGNVAHYDVFFEHGIEKNVPVSSLEILEGHMHEHVIHSEGYQRDPEQQEKERKTSKQTDPSKDNFTGIGDSIEDIMKQNAAMKKAAAKKKVKKESLSDWRTDLNDLVEIVAEPEDKAEKEVVEKTVKNKVVINPKFTEAVEEMGGELLEMVEVTEEYAPEIESAVEYFYEEGINEEGLDAIIEEVGLDIFVEFVIDSAQDLNEERAARKMTARNLQTLKKKTIPAAKEAEAKRQKEKKGEYSAAYKKKETDVTVYDKAKAKPKAKVKPAAKKVAAVTKQVKKLQPAKKASKQGLGDKIRGAIQKGVARHQAARAKGREPEKRVKEFGKGFASGVKGAVKFAGKVKKVVSEEDVVKKELKDLKKGAETLKGKNIAKADKVVEGKNCGCGQNPCVTYGTNVSEDYETKKKSEVMAALKKRTLDKKTKNKIADDIVKKKGDTSKSDDRYAYEGYQRDPEKGEEEARKADKRSAKEKRMADPDRGINSPAFKEFMRSRGM